MRVVVQSQGTYTSDAYINEQLGEQRWTRFRAAVAFARLSGVTLIDQALRGFIARPGTSASLLVGVDLQGTSEPALRQLLDIFGTEHPIWIRHNEAGPVFHPKMYVFDDGAAAEVFVGSANLTRSGLHLNDEAGVCLSLSLSDPLQASVFRQVEAGLANLSQPGPLVRRLSEDFLEELVDRGYVVGESEAAKLDSTTDGTASRRPHRGGLFGSHSIAGPGRPEGTTEVDVDEVVEAGTPQGRLVDGFLMTLQRTDVGSGQTTPGTSRRSPEVFIPLVARDTNPDFWGYPDQFEEDPVKEGKMDRHGVRFRLGGQTVLVNMMTWPEKHDFRLRSETLRSAGDVGDILRIEKAPDGAGYDYYAEVIPEGTADYNRYLALCREPVRNSQKRFGYYRQRRS